MYNIAIDRYFTYRDSIPFIWWGTLADTSDSHYGSYVAGNPFIFPLWGGFLTNVVAPDSASDLERREFRVGGKRDKGHRPLRNFRIEMWATRLYILPDGLFASGFYLIARKQLAKMTYSYS